MCFLLLYKYSIYGQFHVKVFGKNVPEVTRVFFSELVNATKKGFAWW